MKNLSMPSLAFVLAATLSGNALVTPVAAQTTGQPVPPPPRGASPAPPTSPPSTSSPTVPPAGRLQGPPAEELVRQITAGRSFPITVDEISRLDSVEGRGDTLTYNYTILSLPETHEERMQLSQRVKDGIDARACATPDFAKLLEGGYTIVLNYIFGSTEEDVHIRVTPRRCSR